MQNALKTGRAVFQEMGTVAARSDAGLEVETPSGRFPALTATSCLVAPEPNDHVLVAVPPAGALYVLAVLSRPSDTPVRLRLDRDAALECAGSLSLFGADGVDIRSPEEVSTTAKTVTTSAIDAVLNLQRFTFVSKLVELHGEQVQGVFRFVDTAFERLSQKLKRSYRHVEELDLTRARQVEVRASETVNVRGKNAFMSAEDLVKMQGEQIHLG
ncbi:MAG TPA: DUF3540 domain-containing protein [Sandaracinaceae bacterium LLY-WYZ-13_1]|nr:DUF3540 domain-containing protein [Sandaracinaceae bacterium LLY-WYZ-13_1]